MHLVSRTRQALTHRLSAGDTLLVRSYEGDDGRNETVTRYTTSEPMRVDEIVILNLGGERREAILGFNNEVVARYPFQAAA